MKPTNDEINNLKIGDVVRLFFAVKFQTDDGCRAERMWVEIFEANHGRFKGYLTKAPVYLKDLAVGDVVEFPGDHIATVMIGSRFDEKQKAIITKRAIEKREVNGVMKDAPLNGLDGGWQLFYGNEDDAYTADPANAAIVSLGGWIVLCAAPGRSVCLKAIGACMGRKAYAVCCGT